jgi:hypothetical protein
MVFYGKGRSKTCKKYKNTKKGNEKLHMLLVFWSLGFCAYQSEYLP